MTPTDGATVFATVRNYQPDTTAEAATGYSASRVGAISEGDRLLIVMARNLAAADFPLPLQKGDRVVLQASDELPPAGETLDRELGSTRRNEHSPARSRSRRSEWLSARRRSGFSLTSLTLETAVAT